MKLKSEKPGSLTASTTDSTASSLVMPDIPVFYFKDDGST